MQEDAGLVERYLEHVRVQKRLAARTVELYALDLQKLSENAQKAGVPLLQVQNAHVRRWVAQMHGGGRSGRGIGLILSGWRGFYTWLGREGLVKSNPVQDVRVTASLLDHLPGHAAPDIRRVALLGEAPEERLGRRPDVLLDEGFHCGVAAAAVENLGQANAYQGEDEPQSTNDGSRLVWTAHVVRAPCLGGGSQTLNGAARGGQGARATRPPVPSHFPANAGWAV